MAKGNESEDRSVSGGRILFVNSFKGGAGKTTLSLMHCISGLFQAEGYHKSNYRNVIYLDLDVMGTGTCYLFDEKRVDREHSFAVTGKPVGIPLVWDRQEKKLQVAYLDPSFKNQAAFGDSYFVNHQSLMLEEIKHKVLGFIRRQFQEQPQTMLVIDCAPGYSELEQRIMEACYSLAMEKDIALEEYYVSTLDTAHIRKCIQCVKDIKTSIGMLSKYRQVSIVLNDVQNYAGYVVKEEGKELDDSLQQILVKMRNELGDCPADIYFWKYSGEIALRTTYSREQKVENQVGDYLFTKENYRKC